MTTIANVLPDLPTITSVAGLRDATTDSVIARLSTGTFVDPVSSSPASTQPATIVDLSDHAKAVLARAKTEQVAADRLDAQVRRQAATPLGRTFQRPAIGRRDRPLTKFTISDAS